MSRVIELEHRIRAHRQQVWQVLGDTSRYAEWNPFLRNVSGRIQPGGRLLIQMQPPGGNPLRFMGRIEQVEPEHELVWAGQLLTARLFCGEFGFRLERARGGETRLVQRARFSGSLASWVPARLYRRQEEGLQQMGDALGRYLENRPGPAGRAA